MWIALLLGALAPAPACTGAPGGAAAQNAEDPLIKTLVAERAGLAAEAYRGRRLFVKHCAVCHGETGEGDGFNAFNLDRAPGPLREALRLLDDPQIAKVIREGSAGQGRTLLSPPYGTFFSPEEVADLTAYIRTLGPPQ